MKNPWMREAPIYYPRSVRNIQSVSVDDRKAELRNFNDVKLRAVIKYPHTQKTVRIAAVRMLKRREKYADKNGS